MELIVKILPALLEGTKTTIFVFIMTVLLSLPLGGLLGLIYTRTQIKVMRWVVGFYIWVIRGTPLLLQLLIVFFGFPLIGVTLQSRMLAVLVAFVLNYTAYFTEIFRGGIEAVPQGQYEAAQVLGLSKWQAEQKVIIPQVMKIIFPSLGNEVVTLVKDTSLIYALGLSEVMKAGRIAMQREASIVPMIVVGVIYLILTGTVILSMKWLEKRKIFQVE
ncbi:amino acid ABC transporter permease [Vagococcus hydrophili]|uniref:Amino acid ABC transporter permease n=1 Tax=Vagococcus hydrophili TaxID=2714947 RepID=A0A6G8AUC5_9ENTE|nr:amino acid ABC transporter permease [Vagococcus hydrophili]QIL48545.1 amino acid ABC transporter permease [Vagococcus hydrophili]